MPDRWVFEFRKRAGPKLRELFDVNSEEMPPEIVERLERLRQLEKKLLEGNPKKGRTRV